MLYFLLVLAFSIQPDIALRFTNYTKCLEPVLSLPSAPRANKSNKSIFFMHIPKCAGTSFTEDMVEHVLPGTPIVSKEGCWGDARGSRVFTMLRSPRAHVLSMFFHCKTSSDHVYGHPYMPEDFVEWLQMWHDHRVNFRTGPIPFCCYRADNLQTGRYLCGGEEKPKLFKDVVHSKPISTSKAFAELMYRFKRTAFIGLVEAYTESLCLLHIQERNEFPDWCECTGEVERPTRQSNETHGSKAHSLIDYPDSVIAMIDNITAYDRKLYSLAKRRFLREIRAAEDKFGKKILCKHINLEVENGIMERNELEAVGICRTVTGPEPDNAACSNWMIKATNLNLTVPHP